MPSSTRARVTAVGRRRSPVRNGDHLSRSCVGSSRGWGRPKEPPGTNSNHVRSSGRFVPMSRDKPLSHRSLLPRIFSSISEFEERPAQLRGMHAPPTGRVRPRTGGGQGAKYAAGPKRSAELPALTPAKVLFLDGTGCYRSGPGRSKLNVFRPGWTTTDLSGVVDGLK